MGKFKNKAEYEAWKKGQGAESQTPPEQDEIQAWSTQKSKEASSRQKYFIAGGVIVTVFVFIAFLSAEDPAFAITVFLFWIPVIGAIYFYARKSNREKLFKVDNIICPNTNCNYKGQPTKTPRANTGLGLLLCLFFLLPGILYFIIKSGYRYTCPRCGVQLRSDV